MNKNRVKYLHGINFSQLTLAEKTGIKNLGHATSDLVICQSSSSRTQTDVRKFNPAIFAKHKWLSGCAERNAVLGLLINHFIICSPIVRKSHKLPLVVTICCNTLV
jgi:hypothetical protein